MQYQLLHAFYCGSLSVLFFMMKIRKASDDDYEAVRNLYYRITDGMLQMGLTNSWQHDVYPSQEFIKGAIASGTLYIGFLEDIPVSAMVLNRECNDGYERVVWPSDIPMADAMVIHALGVHTDYCGRGIAGEMTRFAISEARHNGAHVLRLDVLEGNNAAEKVYVSAGFVYAGTVTMFYEDTGWVPFRLFECLL